MSGDVAAAIEWARETRETRDAFVADITAHDLGVDELASRCVDPAPAIASLRLLPCIEAMPVAGGKVRSRRAIAAAGLDEGTPLGEISEAQWHALARCVGATPTPAASSPEE